MNLWGVGPKIVISTLVFSTFLFFISTTLNLDFEIFSQSSTATILAIIFIIIGLIFLIFTNITFRKKFFKDTLLKTGAYSFCRNPIYASWIFFLIPGLMLFFNSYIMLTTPFFGYLIFRILIKKEELYLKEKFGEEYLQYKKTTNQILPVPKLPFK